MDKDDGSDVHLLNLYQEHMADLKREISELRNEMLAVITDISHPILSNTHKQDDNIFDMSVKLKRLLFLIPSSGSLATTPTDTTDTHSVIKAPKD